jgi:dihydropteroate synthase
MATGLSTSTKSLADAAERPSQPLLRSYCRPSLELRGKRYHWGTRTFVMGIINATPDSFSGDGTGGDVARAVEIARQFESEGVDFLDLGAESSRPGAEPLSAHEELERLLPSLKAVREITDLPISVDTYHAGVASVALECGADAVNDISGLRADPEMATVIAESGCALVAMHNQRGREFRDVADDIATGFATTLAIAEGAGIGLDRLVLDPGFGFGWTPEQNLEMLRRLPELWSFNLPLLVGTSRKSTIGLVLGTPASERLEGTAASVALAVAGGADIVRVHDVREMTRVVRVSDAIVRANWRSQPS